MNKYDNDIVLCLRDHPVILYVNNWMALKKLLVIWGQEVFQT